MFILGGTKFRFNSSHIDKKNIWYIEQNTVIKPEIWLNVQICNYGDL